jgi:hypothetical protein
MADETPDVTSVPLSWLGVEDLAILAANQIVVQVVAKNEFVVMFGQVAPPILLGSEEEVREQLRTISFAPVKPVARLGLTRQRIQELVDLLTRQLEVHDNSFSDG